MDRATLQRLADVRLKDAEVLLGGGRWDGAYYFLGYCIEYALKACIAKQFRLHDVPAEKLVRDFYSHNLEALVATSELKPALQERVRADQAFRINWTAVKDWQVEARYKLEVTEARKRDARCSREHIVWSPAMAENIVVKEQLTREMIDAGAELTEKLDQIGLPILLAMWFFTAEDNEWRLIFASPELSTYGPQTVYRKIDDARQALGERAETVPLTSIGLLTATDQLVELLRKAVHTGPGVSRVRFSKNAINGRFVEDALIYRAA